MSDAIETINGKTLEEVFKKVLIQEQKARKLHMKLYEAGIKTIFINKLSYYEVTIQWTN